MKIGQSFWSGERPRMAEHLLKEFEAKTAQNCDLSRGDLRPLKAHARVQDFDEVTALQSLYNWKTAAAGNHWIAHENDLDFVRSPIAGESHSRVYVTGMDEPRALTTSIMSGPFDFATDYYKLGVPAPAAGLTVNAGYVVGSSYRAYIYTYVVMLGADDAEEGSNSAIVSVSNYGSGNVTLSAFTAPPASRSIGKIRIYRTNSGTAGVAEFQYVGEFETDGVDFATYTFVDNVADADLGEVLTTENWTVPPTGLKGIISPDGGSLFGFVGNRVYVSEPFLPHAWPYSYPVDANIIGLGFVGNTVAVMTDESPYLMSGQAAAIYTQKLAGRYPCVSKRGIVSGDFGVMYPSDEGIAHITNDGVTLYSYEYFARAHYATNMSPTSISGVYYNGKYYAFHAGGCFVIDTRDKTLSAITDPAAATAVHVSLVDNGLYFIALGDDATVNALYQFEGNDTEDYLQYTYASKDRILDYVTSFAAARIVPAPEAMDNAANIIANAAIFAAASGAGAVDGQPVNEEEVNYDGLIKTYSSTFNLYADGSLLYTKTIQDGEPFRLPAGSMYRRCYYELIGDFPIAEFTLATSMEELNT